MFSLDTGNAENQKQGEQCSGQSGQSDTEQSRVPADDEGDGRA